MRVIDAVVPRDRAEHLGHHRRPYLGSVVGLRIEEIRTGDALPSRLAERVTSRSFAAGSLVVLGFD